MVDAGLRVSSATGRWGLVVCVLASALASIDATVVNVALPAIGQDLTADLAALQWTVTAYTLTLASFILLGGALGDRYGRRRLLIVGAVWFAVASLLCGLAPTAAVLVVARALQGVGGALLVPASLAVIQASFRPDDRARAIGAWTGLSGVATAVGPFLGGWLIGALSWRWVFGVNLPLAILVVVLARVHLPETRDANATGRVDLAGAVLGALALGGLTYGLIALPGAGLASPQVLAALTTALLGAVAFVMVERRLRHPMLPLGLFRSRQFSGANAVTFILYGAFGGILFLLAVVLQVVSGFSALAAGTALLPITVIMLLFSARAGRVATVIGPRIPMTVGPLICAAAMLLMLRIGPDASYVADVLPAMVVWGLGLAVLVAPLTATVLAAVADRHAGVASGVNNAVARAAALLAVSALPAVAGLSGNDAADPAALNHGWRVAVVVAAAALLTGSLVALLTVRGGRAALQGSSAAAGPDRPAAASPPTAQLPTKIRYDSSVPTAATEVTVARAEPVMRSCRATSATRSTAR
ncbi:MAG: DHA2 family efflux MFS transporter permease subunit [Actinomycetota bacterium]|nr:MAG: DHA2 family efflux MFS transporter permease subunit [Actinomycetota bacterium]